MTVYLEYVLLDNFVIDYLLLKTALKVVGKKPSKLRLVFSSVLGTIIALVYPLITNKALSIAVKVLCGFLLTLIVSNYNSKREYLVLTILFFAFTFLVGGAIMGVYAIFNLDYSSEISIALMIIPAYICIKGITEVVVFIYRRKSVMQMIYKVELVLGEVSVLSSGFLDTGNGVYYGDTPVIFITKKTAKKFFSSCSLPKMVKIEVGTINGKSKFWGFKLDCLKLYTDDKENIITSVIACVTKSNLGVGYDVILHPDLMESVYEKPIVCGKRVS